MSDRILQALQVSRRRSRRRSSSGQGVCQMGAKYTAVANLPAHTMCFFTVIQHFLQQFAANYAVCSRSEPSVP